MDENFCLDHDERKPSGLVENLGAKNPSHSERIQKYRGVRKSDRLKELLPEVGIERNLIKVPICVSNPKCANVDQFVYEFGERVINGEKCIPKLIISSGASTPLPLPQHAKVLDILLAMLAHNFNDEGEVYFRFNDVSRLIGHCLTQNRMIKEAIKRYHYNPIYFQHCWVKDPGHFTSQGFLIIVKTDLYDGDSNIRNPRSSNKKEYLHYVKFAPEIVRSVKTNFIRLFPKEAFSELDSGTYTLYKLFYAPTDREPIIRSVYYIANFLGWGNRIDRLRKWIPKHLKILQEKEFILWWRANEDCFEVCSNAARFKRHIAELRRLNPLKAETTKALALKESRKKAKLVGKNIDLQTQEMASNLSVEKKKIKKETSSTAKLFQTEEIFSQLAKMTPMQRSQYLSSMKEIPLPNKNDFLTTTVANFLDVN